MRENSPSQPFAGRALPWLLPFLVITAAYLYAFPQPNIFYAVVVLLHALGGVFAAILVIPILIRVLGSGSWFTRAGWTLIVAAAILGLILIKTGTPRTEWRWLYLHIAFSLVGVALLFAEWLGERGWLASGFGSAAMRATICLIALAAVGYSARYIRESWHTGNRIQNPGMPPGNMEREGDVPHGPFFSSSAEGY